MLAHCCSSNVSETTQPVHQTAGQRPCGYRDGLSLNLCRAPSVPVSGSIRD